MPKLRSSDLVVSSLLSEVKQTHRTRRPLIDQIQETLHRTVISFFTSTSFPVAIDDHDVDMIEGMLQVADLSRGLTLILNSPGGSALSVERIINTCRTYTRGDFEVLVPRLAKSAATMICLGARKIWMSKTSELGPIDPQVVIRASDGTRQLLGAYYVIESYKELFDKAVRSKGNIDPYLQQLGRYDAREIRVYEEMTALGLDIAVKSLKTGMMKQLTPKNIEKSIEIFLNPRKSKTHGRPIYIAGARASGLKVEEIDVASAQWAAIWELYLRSERFVNTDHAKLCESVADSFTVSVPASAQED